MRLLVDADNLAIAVAASAEDAEEWVACARADEMMSRCLEQSECDEYELWLTGKGNFRYNIYPEYKANRIDKPRPRHEQAVKAHLRNAWQANTSEGCEADDMIGVRLTELGDKGCAGHLDKDINMVPGWHYGWELSRKGVVVKQAKKYYVSPEEGLRFFYYQMLVGDSVDNLKGVVGIGPKKAEQLLLGLSTVKEYNDMLREHFSCDEEIDMQGGCLWIWRKPNDIWTLSGSERMDTSTS